MNTHIIIMAGGVGSRLKPLSTEEHPKQFIDILGLGKTLIQMTVDRFKTICPMENIWIVTNEKYVHFIKEQLPGVLEENILTEPVQRNTAPCISYACWKIAKKHPNANVVVVPSDALVKNVNEFVSVIKKSISFIETSTKSILTIGIKPSRPETGYGYIHRDSLIYNNSIYKVKEFKEKPDILTAEKYIADTKYFWNAGIFIWNVQTIKDSIKQFTPDLYDIMECMSKDFYTEKEKETVNNIFPICEKISIDYAVMEKSKNIYVCVADFEWDDLGSWESVNKQKQLLEQNPDSFKHIIEI